jgi:hypothetical protein
MASSDESTIAVKSSSVEIKAGFSFTAYVSIRLGHGLRLFPRRGQRDYGFAKMVGTARCAVRAEMGFKRRRPSDSSRLSPRETDLGALSPRFLPTSNLRPFYFLLPNFYFPQRTRRLSKIIDPVASLP